MPADEPTDHTDPRGEGAGAVDDERTPRPPIVVPKATRLAIGAAVIIVGVILLIVGAAALKAVGAVLAVGGIVDVVVGRRQRV